MSYLPGQSDSERRLRGVNVSNSDSGVPSAKSYASATTVDPHANALWDSCRSNHRSEVSISNSNPESSTVNLEAMKKYFADRNAMQQFNNAMTEMHTQDSLRNKNQTPVHTALNTQPGDRIEEPSTSYTRQQVKDSRNDSGDANGHWPFSFSTKGPRTKREDQNAYRRELDKQIQAKKQIQEKEMEKLRNIPFEKTPETFIPEKPSNPATLQWISDTSEKRLLGNYSASSDQNYSNNINTNFLALDEKQSSNFIMPPGAGQINPQQQHMVSMQGQNSGLPPNLIPLGLGRQPNQNQIQHQYSQQNQTPPFPILKDVNTGIYYQQVAPMQNQPQFHHPDSAQHNMIPVQNIFNENQTPHEVIFPKVMERNEESQKIPIYLENDDPEMKISNRTDDNDNIFKDWPEDYDNNLISKEDSHSNPQKLGEFRQHVSQSCDQRPGSAALRANLRLTLDKQVDEKRQFEKQRREKEIEEEKKLQKRIQMDREKAQKEVEEENRKRKEKEEAKCLRQQQAFEKEEMLRKETEERKRQEKEQRRKMLRAIADEELEYINQNLEGQDEDENIKDMIDDRPLDVPKTREASTQSAWSGQEQDRDSDCNVCMYCSGNSRGDLSSALTNYSLPENEESNVPVEPLLFEFTSALALEAGRLEKLLHTLPVQ